MIPSPIAPSANPGEPAWHVLSSAEALSRLGVESDKGLSEEQAAERAALYGPNAIQEHRARNPWRILFDQFTDFMILVLIAAAVISGLIGDPPDAIAIMVIVLLNGVIGFIQEYRAERAVAALKRMAAPQARAIRDGQVTSLPAGQLVPGDMVWLEAGNVVPADLRLVEAIQLKIEEAALTGESVTVEKRSDRLAEASLPLGDRVNMAFKGTLATNGRGRGVVVATGMATELGKIAALLGEGGTQKTPLQRRLAQFGQRLSVAALAICALVFIMGVLRGESVVLMFLTAVSLAVAAIPEALPAVVTVSLALGARKMVKKRALIRRLPAVETLGSVTYICSDKTGTLTQNHMRVEEIHADGTVIKPAGEAAGGKPTGTAWNVLYRALALCNDAVQDDRGRVLGDPTEVALYAAASEAGFDKAALERTAPRLGEIPFDSDRKQMTTLHRDGERILALTKGAPEQVLERCVAGLESSGTQEELVRNILERADRMAADGLRVLAVACREWGAVPSELRPEVVEQGLTFIGLVGLMDPPREEAQEAVRLCRSAGIVPVMITGDHPTTARAIASRLGILEEDGSVMTGQELSRLSLKEFERQVEEVRVYARVAPEQKIKIVRALQDKGEFVAMTGDGVNDAPALKRADIGVAMGLAGTDVARESSAMILLDDNFATIVAAVREGRRIFDNIRKFIRYTMTSNAGEIWTIFLAPFFGLPIPLLPIHILWVNLVTDGLPGLALAVEPEEKGIMQRPPRPPNESIWAHGMWQDIIWVGLLMGGVCIFTQGWAYQEGSAHWQTMVFTVLTLSQMGNVLSLRSERESVFTQGLFSNRPLLGAVMLTFALQMATIYVPVLNPIFKTQPLTAGELGFCLLLSSMVFFSVELEKWLIRRGWIQWG